MTRPLRLQGSQLRPGEETQKPSDQRQRFNTTVVFGYLWSIVSHTDDRNCLRRDRALFASVLSLVSSGALFQHLLCKDPSAESKQPISCLHRTRGHLIYCALYKLTPIYCVMFPILLSLVNRNNTVPHCFRFHFHASSWNFVCQ